MAKHLAPVLAVPRGRIFWRLTAPSRHMEAVAVAGDQPSPAPGTRTGRHGAGRFSTSFAQWLVAAAPVCRSPDRCCQSLRDAQSGRESRPGAGEQPGIIVRSACWSGPEQGRYLLWSRERAGQVTPLLFLASCSRHAV